MDQQGMLGREITRRRFISVSAKTAAGIAVGSLVPLRALATIPGLSTAGWPADPAPNAQQLATLRAALAQMIPASDPGDWSAADVGADNYIRRILAGTTDTGGAEEIYAGGPFRVPRSSLDPPYSTGSFAQFQPLSWAKEQGWSAYALQQRQIYADGLARLDSLAGGAFATAPAQMQVAILESEDAQGTAFFASLYNHTMEGTYAHPVYRAVDPADSSQWDFRPWDLFAYQGDVHGVRFPKIPGEPGAWDVFGGYAPSEMKKAPGGSQ